MLSDFDLAGVDTIDSRLRDKLLAIRAPSGVEHPKPARYDELIDVMQKDFHASACIPYFSTYIHDLNTGREVSRYGRFSRSFVKGIGSFMEAMFTSGFEDSGVVFTDTGGTSRTAHTSGTSNIDGTVGAGAGDVTYGIVWGTGTNSEVVTDRSVQTLIAHGTSSGQLSYGSTSIGATTASGSATTITVTRSGTNGSGGTVTTEELAVYIRAGYSASTTGFLCIIRDKNTQAVTNGQVITTVYTLSFAL